VVAGLHGRNPEAFDPDGLTRPFGEAATARAPAARWDAMWFLTIAEDGYDGQRAAFFPLYPLLVRAAAGSSGSRRRRDRRVAGLLRRRARAAAPARRAGLRPRGAALTVLLVAVLPGAACGSRRSTARRCSCSVGRARLRGAHRAVGVGGQPPERSPASPRSAGLVLVVRSGPVVARRKTGTTPFLRRRGSGLVPFGLLAFCGLLALSGEDPWGPLRAQEAWMRSFAGPFMAVPQGAEAAWDGARAILSDDRRPRAPFDVAWLDVGLFATLAAVLVAMAGAVRRLPMAYWAYALAALALPLSYPVEGQPLMSLPRFAAVLWPLHLWLALWLVRRGTATRRVVVGGSLAGLAAVSAEVATWGWVA
jgi:hypothetical protein